MVWAQEEMMTEYGTAVGLGRYGLEIGTPGIKSIGSLAFGPDRKHVV